MPTLPTLLVGFVLCEWEIPYFSIYFGSSSSTLCYNDSSSLTLNHVNFFNLVNYFSFSSLNQVNVFGFLGFVLCK
jgi:hypothetical protein